MQYLLSTTGSLNPVSVADFGAREFSHPTVDFDLLNEYTEDEIKSSPDIQRLIDDGHIIVKNGDGVPIGDISSSTTPHDLDWHTDVSAKPNDGKEYLLREESGDLSWVDATAYIKVISAHGSGDSIINANLICGHPVKCNKKEWSLMGTFIFPGSDSIGSPNSFEIIAYQKDHHNHDEKTYVRLYDYTNSQVIAEIEITDDDRMIYISSDIENIPTEKSIIELQGKIGHDHKELYIESMALFY